MSTTDALISNKSLEMQSSICRGCRKDLSIRSSGVNIFSEETLINLGKDVNNQEKSSGDQLVQLYLGIELITGIPVTKTDGLPSVLCKDCYKKLDAFVSFRTQLLTSLRILLEPTDKQNPCGSSKENGNKPTVPKEPELKRRENKEAEFNPDETVDSFKSSFSKPVPEDLINIDEDSTPVDLNHSAKSEAGTNESLNSNNSNDREDNDFNESTSSNETHVQPAKEVFIRVQDNDIESDIDVCSGEDDEVLELDVQSKKDEIVEIESSSESDIEVCDYEPTGKRFKNYSALSPPIYF